MAIPVKVGRNTYKSISAAWRAESPEALPMITVRWRLNQGWPNTIAFRLPPTEPQLRRLGVRKYLEK